MKRGETEAFKRASKQYQPGQGTQRVNLVLSQSITSAITAKIARVILRRRSMSGSFSRKFRQGHY